jgi:sugar (pentulose or hexulose) kinase
MLRPGVRSRASRHACTILGTTPHNGLIVDRPVFEPFELGLLFTLPDHLWLRVMVNLAGTSNLDWALQTFFKEEEAQSLFAKVEQMANSRTAGAGGLVYHPYLSEVGLMPRVIAADRREPSRAFRWR